MRRIMAAIEAKSSGGGTDPEVPFPMTLPLIGWWDASNKTSRYSEASGGSLVTENASKVKRLEDLSGNANHLLSYSGTGPSLTTSHFNGLDVITLESSGNSVLIAPNFVSSLDEISFAMVLTDDGSENNAGFIVFGASSGGTDFANPQKICCERANNGYPNSGTGFGVNFSNLGYYYFANPGPYNLPNGRCVSISKALSSAYGCTDGVDGPLSAALGSSTLVGNSHPGLLIGARYAGSVSAPRMIGRLGELIIWSRAGGESQAMCKQVTMYLKNKWNP